MNFNRLIPSPDRVIAWMIILLAAMLGVLIVALSVTWVTDLRFPESILLTLGLCILASAAWYVHSKPSKSKKVTNGSEESLVTGRRFPHTPPPKPYSEKRSILSPLVAVTPVIGMTVVTPLVLLIANAPVGALVGITLVAIAASAYAIGRERWVYINRPITCDPKDGILKIYQTGIIWPWFIRNSAPDPYPIVDLALRSPQQTWVEQLFFRDSQTLMLPQRKGDDKPLRFVRNLDHLIAIQPWISQEENAMQEDQMIEARRQTRAVESIERMMDEQAGNGNTQPPRL